MTELTEKVLELLRENGIEKGKSLEALATVYSEIEYSIWETFKVNPHFLYGLKDIVWYNLEHLPSKGEEYGQSNLRFLGTKYPNFIYSFNDTEYILNSDIPALLTEIDSIASQWYKGWRLANIYTNVPVSWQGGENPSKVIIHERHESPKKYLPSYATPRSISRTSRILGPNGNQIDSSMYQQPRQTDEYQVFCVIDDEIGEYGQGPIFYGVLTQLREACKSAVNSGKDLRLEFEG